MSAWYLMQHLQGKLLFYKKEKNICVCMNNILYKDRNIFNKLRNILKCSVILEEEYLSKNYVIFLKYSFIM